MLVNRYLKLALKAAGPHLGNSNRVAHFKLDADITRLFPYINAVVEDAIYYEKPHYIQFTLDGFLCALYSDSAVVGLFENMEKVLEFIKRLIDFLNDLHSRRDSIKPDFKKHKYIPILEIYKLLPRSNCRECGFPGCMAFSAALSRGKTDPFLCPELNNPINENAIYPLFDEDGEVVSTISIDLNAEKRRIEIEKQREYIKSLEKRLAAITEEKRLKDSDRRETKSNLTSREIEVLCLMADGFTNSEISGLLSISPHTVKSHVINIFNKIGVNDRTQAAVWATRHKII